MFTEEQERRLSRAPRIEISLLHKTCAIVVVGGSLQVEVPEGGRGSWQLRAFRQAFKQLRAAQRKKLGPPPTI